MSSQEYTAVIRSDQPIRVGVSTTDALVGKTWRPLRALVPFPATPAGFTPAGLALARPHGSLRGFVPAKGGGVLRRLGPVVLSLVLAAAALPAPDRAELLALPEAWTPGTDGTVRASAIQVKASTKEDLEAYRGKLSGRIVFFGELPEIKPHEKIESSRYDEKSLGELAEFEVPGGPPRWRARAA